MVRPLRVDYPDAWHHVTCRGNEKKKIFTDDRDRKKFLDVLLKSSNLYNVEIHAYVLMYNHFHLLVKTPEGNLKSFMQRFNTAYTMYYNTRHQRVGHLYQGRYKSILIEADSYLLELSRYVHLNPVRVKKYSQADVKQKKKILRDHRWSSYKGYFNVKSRDSFVHFETILSMVGNGDNRESRKAYERFVLGAILKNMKQTFWEELRAQVIMGSDEFAEDIYKRYLTQSNLDERELPGIKKLKAGPTTIEEIGEYVAREFGVTSKDLYQKKSPYRIPRSVLMELCRVFLVRSMSLKQIGKELGGVGVSAISQNMKRLSLLIKEDPELGKRFVKLRTILRNFDGVVSE
jgi:REP element-mobilizing transposase RayT